MIMYVCMYVVPVPRAPFLLVQHVHCSTRPSAILIVPFQALQSSCTVALLHF
eukprot:COSAG01_NODE_26324_length_717_cov_3.142395_1_plen_51_part_01